MEILLKSLVLPEGIYNNVQVSTFNRNDALTLQNIYTNWRSLTNELNRIGARGINIPEGLSETLFCILTGAYRVNNVNLSNANSSFDCYNPVNNSRIQVKACSVLPDLTSFGPHSVWDQLIFIDFYANGLWNGDFVIYEIPNQYIYNSILHKEKEETFIDQQQQGRRPRLSLYKLIINIGLQPIFQGNIFNL